MSRTAQQHPDLAQQASARPLSQQPGADQSPAPRPWYREPWPWILMAGPAAAIVGCAITIVLAVQNFSDVAIEDGGVKRGLVVERIHDAGAAATEAEQSKGAIQRGTGADAG